MNSRVAIVTGANTGIGRVTAHEIARTGATTILACRSPEKTLPVIEEIKRETKNEAVELLALDLSSLDSVRAAAATFLASGRPLHILVNNAGLGGQRGTTRDGFEVHFGVNHLGPFLFTHLLLERLKMSAPSRIVNVSSKAHYRVKTFDFERARGATRTVTGMPEYSMSKLANILFTKSLAKRLVNSGVTVYALHPGVVATDVWRRIPWPLRPLIKSFMISEKEGAATSIYCATSDEVKDQNGLYYTECKVREPNPIVYDDALAEKLWEQSAAWCGLSVPAASP